MFIKISLFLIELQSIILLKIKLLRQKMAKRLLDNSSEIRMLKFLYSSKVIH